MAEVTLPRGFRGEVAVWYLGIDGGGTKTTFDLFDGDMCLHQELRLSTCYPAQVGYYGMGAVLSKGV